MRAAGEQIFMIWRTKSRQEADDKLYTDTGRRVGGHEADATATGFYLLTPVHRPPVRIHYPIFFPQLPDQSQI